MQELAKLIPIQCWYLLKNSSYTEKPHQVNVDVNKLTLFRNVSMELTVNNDDNVILRNTCLVIPQALRKRVLALSHIGHMGIEKVKQLLHEKVYFPGTDKAAEDMIKNCLPCQCVSHPDPPEPLKMSKLPPGPWHTLNIDFLGPISSSEYILIAIDQFSRFPEAEITRSTEAGSVIPRFHKIFSVHGLPHNVSSDNGPPWNSNEIKQFMLENGIDHHPVTPHYPQANGLVENINKPIMKAIRTPQVEHRHWHHALYEFLMLYRATPHSSTKFSPSQLLFNRPIRTKLPHCSSITVEISVLSAAR